MKKQHTLMQINVTANWGSTGKIAEDIGIMTLERGWKSIIAYGQKANPSKCELIRVGNDFDIGEHGVESRLFDNNGLASRQATRQFIKKIEEIKPDIIHLQNIHGYYINFKLLFDYLSKTSIPIVWTLHDCWSFTGHCCYFDYANCNRWKTGCHSPCPNKKGYPRSLLIDASKRNYELKKQLFNSVKNLTIVPVSEWLGDLLKESFMSGHQVQVIKNGIDLNTFKPTDAHKTRVKYGIGETPYVIGVASFWEKRKGFDDFILLASKLSSSIRIVLVGLDKGKLRKAQQSGIIGIPRTDNVEELAALYSGAEIFLNLTYEDNYPTTNLEAMACGTPVITYRTGGSPEAVSPETGVVVEQGDVYAMAEAIKMICTNGKNKYLATCRKRAEEHFDKDKCFEKYVKLYEELIKEPK